MVLGKDEHPSHLRYMWQGLKWKIPGCAVHNQGLRWDGGLEYEGCGEKVGRGLQAHVECELYFGNKDQLKTFWKGSAVWQED